MRRETGARYRFLSVGQLVRYVGREGRPELSGAIGEVVAVPDYKPVKAPKTLVVQFRYGPYGEHVGAIVAPAGCFRRVV